MISLKINNIKNFTSMLLVKDTFADFLLVEANIHTHSTFSINGRINSSYYSAEESEKLSTEGYNAWSQLRPICYEIIKGRNLPSYFKFVFRLNSAQTALLLEALPEYKSTDIDGLFLNIKYEGGTLTITTGTSLKIFTLDKTLDKHFDKYINDFFEQNSIDFSIC